MAEIDSEECWNELSSQFQCLLADLEQQALREHEAGKAQALVELE